MMYIRYPLSLRYVEDLLHERGIDISHETVRFRWNRFGPIFAAEIRKRRVSGIRSSHWRSVDHKGTVGLPYAGWAPVAFVSDGIRNQWQVNKINNLRPREGSLAVAFPPPLALEKRFSRLACGRIFPLYSRVMREGLSTGPGAKMAQSVLSGPIFSGPHDCADLVKFLQVSDIDQLFSTGPSISTPVAFEFWN